MSKAIHLKLPPKFKVKWLEALRSEEYNQGYAMLFNYHDNSYCCLGVACRIAEIGRDRLEGTTLPTNLGRKQCKRLPTAIKDASVISHLIWMNDDEEKDFKEIANWIEENL